MLGKDNNKKVPNTPYTEFDLKELARVVVQFGKGYLGKLPVQLSDEQKKIMLKLAKSISKCNTSVTLR